MPDAALPEGRYLSCALRISFDAGGQTRALLMRNRNLVRAGVRPDLIVLGAAPDHEQRRQELLERGLLVDGIGMLNIYDHYREHGWGTREPLDRELADLAPHRVQEEEDAAGTPWRVTYRVPGERYATYDYLRRDGTPYLRIPAFGLAGGSRGRGQVLHIDPQGRIVREYKAAGQWFRLWIRELARGQKRTFVFVDSRHVVPHVVPVRARAVHAVYVMHNLHVLKPYRWDSEVNVAYTRVLRRAEDMDALVTLTERQRDDIAERRGRTSNMFVVPNPVDQPAQPADPPPRDPHRVTIMARLEPQKRLQDAIAAFERVVRAVPEARLDIFGEGGRREKLQQEIDHRQLGGSVTLRGFDPEAREALWTSSAFVLSSAFEGYPLSTLESMSRGCPVVSYDIKYGPREQITDGVDGFLVPARRRRRAGRPPDRAAPLTGARRADERCRARGRGAQGARHVPAGLGGRARPRRRAAAPPHAARRRRARRDASCAPDAAAGCASPACCACGPRRGWRSSSPPRSRWRRSTARAAPSPSCR